MTLHREFSWLALLLGQFVTDITAKDLAIVIVVKTGNLYTNHPTENRPLARPSTAKRRFVVSRSR
jgi:hypothetical protein